MPCSPARIITYVKAQAEEAGKFNAQGREENTRAARRKDC